MKKYKMQICVAAAVLLFAAAVFCGFQVYYKMSRPNVQKILYKNVQLVCLS